MTLSIVEIDNSNLPNIESAAVEKGGKNYQAVALDVGGTGVERLLEISDLKPQSGTTNVQAVHAATASVTTALSSNANRIRAIVQNISDVEVWVRLGSNPSVGSGILLMPRDSFEVGVEYTGDIRCIRAAGAGTKNLFVVEI